jgi:hypothetical protein
MSKHCFFWFLLEDFFKFLYKKFRLPWQPDFFINVILSTTLVELHARNTPAKFHLIWQRVKEEKLFKEIVDARMDDGQ